MTQLLKEVQVHDEPIKKPSKAWWNWWLLLYDGILLASENERVSGGEVRRSADAYPSREVAEQKAIEDLAAQAKEDGGQPSCVKYLGAFPEGDRP